jgi:hypothetical protein
MKHGYAGMGMVEIVHRPLKELVIMDYTRYPSAEALATALSFAVGPGQPVALYWCEGVVFVAYPLPPETEAVAREYLEGRVYWVNVSFALMENYQASIHPTRARGLEVPVIDMSANPTMRKAARWLKENAR